MQNDDELEDDFDEDEPMWWDIVEEQYGRPLTEAEWRKEIQASYEREITEEELQADLQRQKDWTVFKIELAERERVRAAVERKNLEDQQRSETIAADLFSLLCSPPYGDDDEITDEDFEAWKVEVTAMIRANLDFDSLMVVLRKQSEIETRRAARFKALKRHTENHALRDDIYRWADANISDGTTLDAAATEIAEKVVPLKWRTVREHLTEWRKLRSAGIP